MSTWTLDHEAAREYARELGVRWPVEFIRRASQTYWGQHECRLLPPYGHTIRLDSQHRDPTEVGNTLAHELCHALQAEREGTFAWDNLARQQAVLPHDERPIEIEANAFAEVHAAEAAERCIKVRA